MVMLGFRPDKSLGGAAALASLPLCATHDDTAWHGLIDETAGCTFGHSHNADPATANDVFGEPRFIVSLPWATGEEHRLYKWDVDAAWGGCERLQTSHNCLVEWRLLYHPGGAAPPNNVRFHGFFLEAVVCDNAGRCGIVRTGGMMDIGHFIAPYKQASSQIIATIDDPPPPRRLFAPPYHTLPLASEPISPGSERSPVYWVASDRLGYGQVVTSLYYISLDAWGGVDPADPTVLHLSGLPGYDHSTADIYQLVIEVGGEFDADGDGLADYAGWTDERGEVVAGCQAAGPGCVPFELESVPVGLASATSRNRPQHFFEYVPDYDDSPAGLFCITYPN
jgi:hypothetical protein